MGLLDQMFGGGGSKSGGGGGMSPLMLALLGLLAYKTFSGRAGGAAPGGAPAPSPGQAPGAPAPRGDDRMAGRDDDGDGGLGDLLNQRGSGGLGDILAGGGADAGRSGGGTSGGGGLGDILGNILGGGGGAGAGRGGAGRGGLGDILGGMLGGGGAGAGRGGGGGGGGLGDILGSVLGGGAAGGALSGGLGELLNQMQKSGRGDIADSWVKPGPNRLVSGSDIESALDPEVIEVLVVQTGMSREELLAQLSQELPDVVDKLTPEGRLPTREEAARWM